MCSSATSSSPATGEDRGGRGGLAARAGLTRRGTGREKPVRYRVLALILLATLIASAPPAGATVFLTLEEALALAFPGAEVEKRTAYLTDAQLALARELAGVEVESALVTYHMATRDGAPAGTAYLDTHRVRTLPETLMVVVDPGGRVRRIEVLSFREPQDYLPREGWYGQFEGRALDEELHVKRGIRGVTGATLTARVTTEAARRALALHRVLHGPDGADGTETESSRGSGRESRNGEAP